MSASSSPAKRSRASCALRSGDAAEGVAAAEEGECSGDATDAADRCLRNATASHHWNASEIKFQQTAYGFGVSMRCYRFCCRVYFCSADSCCVFVFLMFFVCLCFVPFSLLRNKGCPYSAASYCFIFIFICCPIFAASKQELALIRCGLLFCFVDPTRSNAGSAVSADVCSLEQPIFWRSCCYLPRAGT